MTARPFRIEAHACRIHGTIARHDGDVSIAELSRLLDIDADTVRYIVRRRGWEVRSDQSIALKRWNEEHGHDVRELEF